VEREVGGGVGETRRARGTHVRGCARCSAPCPAARMGALISGTFAWRARLQTVGPQSLLHLREEVAIRYP